MPPGGPLVVLPPIDPPLPPFRFAAELDSWPGVGSSVQGVGSRLYLCWFGDELADSVHDMVWEAWQEVDWESAAADFGTADRSG
jgi:hypothetical protein